VDDAVTLPATVVSAHLRACAAELAAGPSVSELDDLTTLLEDLVAGQRQIADALTHLAGQMGRRRTGPDLTALAEVLGAAASATGHAADALAESRPVLDIVNHQEPRNS
jgi:hypothetical protein